MPGSNLNWVKGHYNSILGEIKSGWKHDGDNFFYDVEIPANTNVTLYLPAENIEYVTENSQPIQESTDVEIVDFKDNLICMKIGSGKYSFKSKNYYKN